MDCVIFDIDGTLADVSHRRHHLGNNGRSPDWKAFFDGMVDDPVIEPVACLLEQLRSDFDIILCSGRPDNYREQTEKWLSDNAIVYDKMFMRPAGDHRSDVIIKRQMLEAIRGDGYNIRFVVDDRQSVVDMWREEGLVCLQAAPGDFDRPKVNCEPGNLHILIGPSGAGKSTFTEQFRSDQVISSDGLRVEICGDMKDQTQNDRVFATLHELVKTRIALGLDTIVDATNLRNRDRRAIRDLVPDDCRIFYYVINRPMEEKRKTAGWRKDVFVKGKPLLEYHEQIFQSNLKDILAGDNDPRVTVYNHAN